MEFNEDLKRFSNEQLIRELTVRKAPVISAAEFGIEYINRDSDAVDMDYMREVLSEIGCTAETAERIGIGYVFDGMENKPEENEPLDKESALVLLLDDGHSPRVAEQIIKDLTEDGEVLNKHRLLYWSGVYKNVNHYE